jgi:flagellar biosynthesis/type III secretory pathway protein FliH
MKRSTLLPSICALIAGVALAGSAFGQAANWKYRDTQGRLVVSDLPPPVGTPDKDILERPTQVVVRRAAPPPAAASAAASGPAPVLAQRTDPELEARRKKAADEQTAQQRAQQEQDNAQRAENCARAKGHLAALSEGQRIARTNTQGEREVLDDKGRAEEMQRARQVIASDCK